MTMGAVVQLIAMRRIRKDSSMAPMWEETLVDSLVLLDKVVDFLVPTDTEVDCPLVLEGREVEMRMRHLDTSIVMFESVDMLCSDWMIGPSN